MTRRIEKSLWILVAILSPLIALQSYFAGNWYSALHSYSLGMLCGVTSYVYFCNALFLSARIRYFDRLYGHNNVLRFHGWLALTALLAAIAHFLLKTHYFTEYTFQMILGLAGGALFAIITLVTILFMARTPLHRIPALERLRAAVSRGRLGDYSLLKLFHNGTSIAAAIIAVHVLLSAATAENAIRMGISGGWAALALGAYVWHKGGRLLALRRCALIVESTSRLAERIVEIRMRGNAARRFDHAPGQFGYFRFFSAAVGIEEHPFTIASAPRDSRISIVVKELGDYSAKLANLRRGDRAWYDGPYGVFTPRATDAARLYIAGGIGITPFLPLLERWRRDGVAAPTRLIWSVRTADECIYRERFEQVQRMHQSFRFVPLFTRQSGDAKRIDRAMLQSLLPPGEPRRMRAYLCGPEPMLDSLIDHLRALGLGRRHIHTERFSF
jgi:predicted ferric reductase